MMMIVPLHVAHISVASVFRVGRLVPTLLLPSLLILQLTRNSQSHHVYALGVEELRDIPSEEEDRRLVSAI